MMEIRSLFLVSLVLLRALTRSETIVDSSCFVRVNYETSISTVSLENAYSIEMSLSKYFDELVRDSSELRSIKPFRFHVDVTDHVYANNKVSLTAIATLLYEYNEENVEPLITDQVLEKLTSSSKAPFQIESSTVVFEFSAAAVPNKFLKYRDPKGKSPAVIGLLVVTILLSILLVTTSSVLLYISGGWAICKRAVVNCLFEEVDDDADNYPVQRKTTYTRSDEEQEHEHDEESNITSVAPSTASGMLGVRGPAVLGVLGTHSNEEDDESSMTYGDNSPRGNIGILKGGFGTGSPKGDDKGFSGMMMQRFGRTPGKHE